MTTHNSVTDAYLQTFKSNPVHVAGGMQMMAKHLLDTIDLATACPERIIEVAQQAQGLLADAKAIAGFDKDQREIYARSVRYEQFAFDKMPREAGR